MIHTALLHTENTVIGYRKNGQDTVIARDVNIRVNAGELVALVGANGIGKSTLLRTLTGIQQPLSGAIFIDNHDIQSLRPQELAQKLSIVLTEKLPPSNLTAYEVIALGRQPYTNWLGVLTEKDRLAIANAIELTQISHLSKKKHFELSDGQLQKVMIARALAQETSLLILDEPTTHLDLQHKAALLRLLKKLSKDTAKGVLFSTHDVDLALQLCDMVIVMTGSAIVQDSPGNLISGNTFESMFADDNIYFDRINRKFSMRDF